MIKIVKMYSPGFQYERFGQSCAFIRKNMIGRIAFGGRIMNDLNLNPRLPYFQLSSAVLGSCFEVMNELGIGFLESVYKNALFLH